MYTIFVLRGFGMIIVPLFRVNCEHEFLSFHRCIRLLQGCKRDLNPVWQGGYPILGSALFQMVHFTKRAPQKSLSFQKIINWNYSRVSGCVMLQRPGFFAARKRRYHNSIVSICPSPFAGYPQYQADGSPALLFGGKVVPTQPVPSIMREPAFYIFRRSEW